MFLHKPPLHIKELPEGCKLCLHGLKSVLFITGLCPVKCFYCPVNPERRGRDVMYINDVPLRNLKTLILEIERCLSKGVAITGGEPLTVPDRVLELSVSLKNTFGDEFHIHIYTNIAVLDKRRVKLLSMCPLDEVRIHTLDLDLTQRKLNLLKLLSKQHFRVGLEVPVLPGFEHAIERVVEILYYNDVISFVNLNEADVSSGNECSLRRLGYKFNPDGTVQGSYETGRRLALSLASKFPDLSINFCTSCTKDAIQVGLRYLYKSFTLSSLKHMIEDDGSVVSVKINSGFAHPGNKVKGTTYRFVPRAEWFEVFEII